MTDEKLARPQPVGIFALPAGYLVLPAGEARDAVLDALLAGKRPAQWPDALAFYARALEGDIEQALAALTDDGSPLARYNRFVLQSSPETYQTLRLALNGELSVLLEIVAYTLGYVDEPPAPGVGDGELAALACATQATQRLETGDLATALALLEEAADAALPASPVLAGMMLAERTILAHQHQGASAQTIAGYRQALDRLSPSGLDETVAELWLNLGICYQEAGGQNRSALMEAVHCYQEALKTLTRADQPDGYALAHNNLALAYLSMPMVEASDQLRMGIAIQSLREALTVYTRDAHPEQWASTQLNLANALQYVPTSHPEENLIEAVELYEEILTVRSPDDDPVGYARLQANLGNALAHLGIFDHARPMLEAAAERFSTLGAAEAAASVYGVLDEIARNQATQEATPTRGSL